MASEPDGRERYFLTYRTARLCRATIAVGDEEPQTLCLDAESLP